MRGKQGDAFLTQEMLLPRIHYIILCSIHLLPLSEPVLALPTGNYHLNQTAIYNMGFNLACTTLMGTNQIYYQLKGCGFNSLSNACSLDTVI